MAVAEAPRDRRSRPKSPYEMRVDLGEDVPETDVRSALKTGDMGFLHSFTTGSAVDGPGIRLVAWTTACMFRCQLLPQPRHLDAVERHPGHDRAGDRASCANMPTGLKAMKGGFTLSGGEPLMQDRFAARLFAAAKAMGVHTAIETNGFYRRAAVATPSCADIDLVILDMKAFDARAAQAGHRHPRQRAGPRLRPPPRRARAADVAALRARARA